MKKVRKYRKLLSSLLIFTLILSMGSGVFAAKSAGAFAKEADQYKIYPIPQSVTYGNSSFIMSEDVNVVAEEGIDKYTVHAALNHVDESMRVTDIYIERDFVNENKANAKVIKYVFGK